MFVQQMFLAAVVATLSAPAVVHAEYDPNNPFYPSPHRNLATTLETPDSATARAPTGQGASRVTERGHDGLSRAQREGLERKARNTELERQGFTSRVP